MENTAVVHGVKGWPAAVKEYVSELQTEMRRVTWPSRKQVESTTVVVIITVFGFAAFFFVVDALVGNGITKIFNAFTR